jgi:hypothetical protein
MTTTHRFEIVLLLIAACVVLTVVARRLRPKLGQGAALTLTVFLGARRCGVRWSAKRTAASPNQGPRLPRAQVGLFVLT